MQTIKYNKSLIQQQALSSENINSPNYSSCCKIEELHSSLG